jgi:uncharacterized membrane protein
VLHVAGAVLWAGGALFQAAIVGPALARAGPAAGGFLQAVARRGGFGPYFGAVATLTVLTGGALYGMEDLHTAMGSGRGLWLTIGAVVAVLAYLHGLFAVMPNERRLVATLKGMQGPPTAEQGAALAAQGAKVGKLSMVSTALVAAALLAMLVGNRLA